MRIYVIWKSYKKHSEWVLSTKYFIPEWDDRVDPNYIFASDVHSSKHSEDPLRNDVYMWDIFGVDGVPFDGVLVSRMKIMVRVSMML